MTEHEHADADAVQQTGEPVSDKRVEEIFNLADQIICAPSRFTKDFVVQELGRGVAELAGAVERARAQLAEIGETHEEWGLRLSTHRPGDAKSYGRGDVGRWEARAAQQQWHTLVHRSAGDWRDAEQEDDRG